MGEHVDYDGMTEWFLGHYAYGHLDQIPEWLLNNLLRDVCVSGLFAGWLCQASKTKGDSLEELAATYATITAAELNEARMRVRKWLVAERLRRMKRIQIPQDVLIKELAVIDPAGLLTANGEALSGVIVEVAPGVVSIVGEELQLCQK